MLVVGGGGREHALTWKIIQSPKVTKVYCAPGNAGTADIAENIDISDSDIPALLDFARNQEIGLTVVGPEGPLVNGIVDEFEQAGLRIFGPSAAAARLEGSKVFAKELLIKYGVPTAGYHRFSNPDSARNFMQKNEIYPIVIKADGLAAGKGVLIINKLEEATKAIQAVMEDQVFGKAGEAIIIEEFLSGPELSMLCFVDNSSIVPMVSSKDYKRIGAGDTGLNTGGMGAISPNPLYDEALEAYCMEHILNPTVAAMKAEGRAFKGILYCGLILTAEGPKVLEYNVRFGDPETQVILPRLKTDLVDIFEAVIDDRLGEVEMAWDEQACSTVVLASKGYPESYPKGLPIKHLESVTEAIVFHAGTKLAVPGIVTSGGRVLNVTALGENIGEALKRSYAGASLIEFEGKTIRPDIGS